MERLRIRQDIGRELHLGRLCARRDHLGQHLLFLMRVSFNRLNQVGNQVGPALVLVQHLAPRRLHLLVERRNFVDAAGRKAKHHECEYRQASERSKMSQKHEAPRCACSIRWAD